MGASLVGRAEELTFARNALVSGSGLVIGGEAGVGKTRLAREIQAGMDGWYVTSTTVTSAAAELPLGGLAALGLLDDSVLAGGPGLLSRLASRLVTAAEGRPVLLVVDDAHLLDPMSAAFVHQVVVSGSASVVVTVRSGEALPSPLTSLVKDGLVPRLELQPLGFAEFTELAAGLVGGPVDPSTTKRLWSATGGNVLFLRELIADARETGTLVQAELGWRWEPAGGYGTRLVELVADRLGRPTQERRALIELLAVGEPLGVGVLERLLPDVDLSEEERRGLITVEERGRRVEVRLAHPLFSEVTRARMPVLARRQVQSRLADTIEQLGARRHDDTLRLAVWRLDSAGATDCDLLLDATRRARQVFDPGLAVRLARACVEQGPSFEAELHLGAALRELGRYREAAGALDGLVGREPDDACIQQLARERAWVVVGGGGNAQVAERLLREAEGRVSDAKVRLMARGELALLLTYMGRFGDVLTVGEHLVADGGDDGVRLRSLAPVGAALVMAGRYERVLHLCDQLEAPARRLREEFPRGVGWVAQMRSNVLTLSGRLEEATRLLEAIIESEPTPTLGAGDVAYARTKLGFARLLQGQPQQALDALAEAIPSLAVTDPNGCQVWCLSLAAQAHSLLGHPAEAEKLASGAEAIRSTGFAVWDGDAARARAWILAAGGERNRPIADLAAIAEQEMARGQPAFAMFSLHDALRLGGGEVAPRLAEVCTGLDGELAAAVGAHARAVQARDPAALSLVADRFARLGMHMAASEAAAAAAEVWGGEGMRTRAARAARARDDHLGCCEASANPALPPAGDLSRLTRREREVALLAGQGLSNAEIAGRLYLSARTVESHLYSAYTKLGINDRAALATMKVAADYR